MPRVLISGGSGLIGQHLGRLLLEKGYEVGVLIRFDVNRPGISAYAWDVEHQEMDPEAIQGCDYLLHLAGANVGAKRWTPRRKREILKSRVESAELLFKYVSEHNRKLKAFITASAIGYYGAQSSESIFRESDPPAHDFLGRTCQAWEQSADPFESLGIRTLKIRIGIVLAEKGGALSRLKVLAKWGLASALGHGTQYMPWIHVDDLCALFLHALENPAMEGAYNAVAPEHITNRELTAKLARALHRPFWFPGVPAFALRLLYGEMAEMLLEGSRISSEKIRDTGFNFQYPDLDSALTQLFSE